jgi:hypothetical protein
VANPWAADRPIGQRAYHYDPLAVSYLLSIKRLPNHGIHQHSSRPHVDRYRYKAMLLSISRYVCFPMAVVEQVEQAVVEQDIGNRKSDIGVRRGATGVSKGVEDSH